MRIVQMLALVLLAAAISTGQILLKIAADQIAVQSGGNVFARAVLNPYLAGAVAIYSVALVGWVWILTGMHLSRAYPFLVLAFVLTPLLALLILHEPVTKGYVFGCALVAAGLYFIVD